MKIKVLSYNLRQGRAFGELTALAKDYQPSVLCLQECIEPLPDSIDDMTLAGSAPIGSVCQAMYFRAGKLKLVDSQSHALKRSLYEKALRDERRRLIVADFVDRKTRAQFRVGTLHASHLLASNYSRRAQIGQALRLVVGDDWPAAVVGDFNYPVFRAGLERAVARQNFALATPETATFNNGVFAGKFDYAAYRNLELMNIETLRFRGSDHAPVLAEFKIRRAS